MASTQEIITAAADLGKLIATHDAAKRFEDVLKKLSQDVDAQRLLNDLNRHATKISQKEMQGQPIEVHEKHELEKLRQSVARSAVLRDFQVAQMDYVDLMRQVDEAMAGRAGGPDAVGAASPLDDLDEGLPLQTP
ncbi:MAG: YlbF family regulator [Phycisphaeraceae bacterium]|nr:YlbF family regulator [Phycisphaeraceae bacterium]